MFGRSGRLDVAVYRKLQPIIVTQSRMDRVSLLQKIKCGKSEHKGIELDVESSCRLNIQSAMGLYFTGLIYH